MQRVRQAPAVPQVLPARSERRDRVVLPELPVQWEPQVRLGQPGPLAAQRGRRATWARLGPLVRVGPVVPWAPPVLVRRARRAQLAQQDRLGPPVQWASKARLAIKVTQARRVQQARPVRVARQVKRVPRVQPALVAVCLLHPRVTISVGTWRRMPGASCVGSCLHRRVKQCSSASDWSKRVVVAGKVPRAQRGLQDPQDLPGR